MDTTYSSLILLGFGIIILGFIVLMIALMMTSLSKIKQGEQKPKSEVRGGGVVLIGPIPIVFGTDKQSLIIILSLTIVIMILAIILLWGLRW
ncbi:MAG: TIGR00304 family protein [Thermoprotei archaeon]